MIAMTHLRVCLRLRLLQFQGWLSILASCCCIGLSTSLLALYPIHGLSPALEMMGVVVFLAGRVALISWRQVRDHPIKGEFWLVLPLSARAQNVVDILALSLGIGLVLAPLFVWLELKTIYVTSLVLVWILDAVANLVIFDPSTRRVWIRLRDSLRGAVTEWGRGRRTEAPRYRAPFTKSSYRRWVQRTWIHHTLLLVGFYLVFWLCMHLMVFGDIRMLSLIEWLLLGSGWRWLVWMAVLSALMAVGSVQFRLMGRWAQYPLPVSRGWLVLRSWVWTLVTTAGFVWLLYAVMPFKLWPSHHEVVKSTIVFFGVGQIAALVFMTNSVCARAWNNRSILFESLWSRAGLLCFTLFVAINSLTVWIVIRFGTYLVQVGFVFYAFALPLAFFLLTLRPVYQAWREGGLRAKPYWVEDTPASP